MSEFEIHNDPFPRKSRPGGPGREPKYPFAKLEVGQCVYAPLPDGVRARDEQGKLLFLAKFATKGLERDFTTRIIHEKNVVGVWRVK